MILKSTNYFETNNASTKIVPKIDYKKGYSYHVSNQPKVFGCSENHRHSLSCLLSVTNLETENHLEYRLKKLSNYLSVENSEKIENACL